ALVLLFVHLLLHARRYIHGKVFFGLAGTAFVLAAVGIFGMPYLDRWYHQVYVERNAVIAGDKVSIPGRVLTVYFSRVGNTNFPSDVDAVSGASIMKDRHEIIGNAEMIAYMVQDAAGGDIFAIQTEKNYPADYGETTKEGKRELESGKAPTLKRPLPQMENYDVIFLVYPLWWNTLPMPVEGFLKQYDWTGKILVPIVTHGGGGTGESLEAVQKATQAKIPENYLDIYSSDIPAARQKITDYLKKLR
uniref:flavodoxin n=1 Tax=Selenomonas ruminantium TaxID=971 RepID=UPI0026EF2CA0